MGPLSKGACYMLGFKLPVWDLFGILFFVVFLQAAIIAYSMTDTETYLHIQDWFDTIHSVNLLTL